MRFGPSNSHSVCSNRQIKLKKFYGKRVGLEPTTDHLDHLKPPLYHRPTLLTAYSAVIMLSFNQIFWSGRLLLNCYLGSSSSSSSLVQINVTKLPKNEWFFCHSLEKNIVWTDFKRKLFWQKVYTFNIFLWIQGGC